MAVFVSNFNILKMQFAVINHLLKKGVISPKEAKEILKESLNPELTEKEKEKILDSLFSEK